MLPARTIFRSGGQEGKICSHNLCLPDKRPALVRISREVFSLWFSVELRKSTPARCPRASTSKLSISMIWPPPPEQRSISPAKHGRMRGSMGICNFGLIPTSLSAAPEGSLLRGQSFSGCSAWKIPAARSSDPAVTRRLSIEKGGSPWAWAAEECKMTGGRAGFPHALFARRVFECFRPRRQSVLLRVVNTFRRRKWRPPFYGERRNGAGIFGIGPKC